MQLKMTLRLWNRALKWPAAQMLYAQAYAWCKSTLFTPPDLCTYVDGGGVDLGAKQQLWRAVPECDHSVGVGLEG